MAKQDATGEIRGRLRQTGTPHADSKTQSVPSPAGGGGGRLGRLRQYQRRAEYLRSRIATPKAKDKRNRAEQSEEEEQELWSSDKQKSNAE